jgi:hypothetical protein
MESEIARLSEAIRTQDVVRAHVKEVEVKIARYTGAQVGNRTRIHVHVPCLAKTWSIKDVGCPNVAVRDPSLFACCCVSALDFTITSRIYHHYTLLSKYYDQRVYFGVRMPCLWLELISFHALHGRAGEYLQYTSDLSPPDLDDEENLFLA